MAIDQRSDNKTRLTRYFFIIILLFFIISVFATVFGASGWKASSQSVKCHGQVYPCDEINERDWDVKCTMTKTPSKTFAHYKCSLGEHSQGCRLTFTRQECDCGNAWYRITDNQNQSRLECRTCLPNRKSQTGGYHKEDNKIDFRVFLGLNISLKSIRKDFVIFNTENSFLHPSF